MIPELSAYGQALLDVSPVSRLMASFAREFRPGVDINVGVGYVNEATLPYQAVLEATKHVVGLPDVFRSSLNYGDPAGTYQLRQAIQQMLIDEALPEDRSFYAESDVLIGTNGATSILEGLAQIYDPGIVIMADPVYYIYSYFLERKGYTVIGLPEDANGMIPELLEQTLFSSGLDAGKLRFVYVVSISNPTSSILTNERRHAIVDIVNRYAESVKAYIPLIFDQAYVGLIHDPAVEDQESAFRNDRNNLVYEVGTLSKILAPALRIGYIAGRAGTLLSALQERNSDAGFSASPLNQQVSAVLLTDYLPEQRANVLEGYRERATVLRQMINDTLGEYLEEVRGGSAGFYFYLTFRSIRTDDQSLFYKFLNRSTGDERVDGTSISERPARLAYIPGQYCVLQNGSLKEVGNRSMRLSYGFEPLPRLVDAIRLIAEAIDYVNSQSRI